MLSNETISVLIDILLKMEALVDKAIIELDNLEKSGI